MDLFDQQDNGAQFSDCRKYRFVLWRIWDKSKPKIMIIGLNPSTANAVQDDPTIRRIKSLARLWGYGGFYMLNLFTYITPYPEELLQCTYPTLGADWHLIKYSKIVDKVIFAWGNFKVAEQRAKEVKRLFPNAYVMGINQNGSPKHPLYLSGKTQLNKYIEL